MDNSVVRLVIKDDIAYVYFEEKEGKNTFTTRFICGIRETFEEISQNKNIKVVIVQGYDSFFCCGGTKASLYRLYNGIKNNEHVDFTNGHFFDTFLKCEIPVIAVVNGHALGGGLAFTMFADFLVISEQSIISGNYMRYGFTPGMGATYIIPKKLGVLLGWEMLYTAKNYFGFELKKRCPDLIIEKKENIIRKAEELANNIRKSSREDIIETKRVLTNEIRRELPFVIKNEIAMHKVSFAQPEVYDNISQFFKE